jgi:hypothetical protein
VPCYHISSIYILSQVLHSYKLTGKITSYISREKIEKYPGIELNFKKDPYTLCSVPYLPLFSAVRMIISRSTISASVQTARPSLYKCTYVTFLLLKNG